MSQTKIPDNNLPIYFQKYEVNILNTSKLRPCNKKSCVSNQRGCCPDNVTHVPPSGKCDIGGCAGKEFGCCPYSTEAKSDREGSNCGTIAGSVLYTTVGAIPSNKIGKRIWQLNLSGSLKPGVEKYYIVYDFQKVDYKEKDQITFEDLLSGTFNICGQVLDARRYLKYEYCIDTLTLTIIIDTKKWDFRLKKDVAFSYDLNINDCIDCCGPCGSEKKTPPNLNDVNGLSAIVQLNNGDNVTLTGCSYGITIGVTVVNNNGVLQLDSPFYWLEVCDQWYKVPKGKVTGGNIPLPYTCSSEVYEDGTGFVCENKTYIYGELQTVTLSILNEACPKGFRDTYDFTINFVYYKDWISVSIGGFC